MRVGVYLREETEDRKNPIVCEAVRVGYGHNFEGKDLYVIKRPGDPLSHDWYHKEEIKYIIILFDEKKKKGKSK